MGCGDLIGASDPQIGNREAAVGSGGYDQSDPGFRVADGDAGAGQGFAFGVLDETAEGGGGDLAIELIDRE